MLERLRRFVVGIKRMFGVGIFITSVSFFKILRVTLIPLCLLWLGLWFFGYRQQDSIIMHELAEIRVEINMIRNEVSRLKDANMSALTSEFYETNLSDAQTSVAKE